MLKKTMPNIGQDQHYMYNETVVDMQYYNIKTKVHIL